jgi:hypothetical protein
MSLIGSISSCGTGSAALDQLQELAAGVAGPDPGGAQES